MIRELDDDQAVVAMVDSNLHRENLKPSEKAFAYKMKLDAMKHQGKHLDSGALAQVGPKFTDGSQLNEKGNNTSTINSNELLARQVGESVAQIKRYISPDITSYPSPYGLVLTRSGTSTPSFSILLISSHNSVFISTLNG